MRVRVIGGLVVEGVAERDLGSRKGRTVLKVLALARGAPVRADRLADILWGDAPPARPLDQVGVLVSRLRGVLGADRLPRTDAGYALVADWLDVDELAALVDAAATALADGRLGAARAAADAALALARGPVLPDEDGDWVEVERVAAAATLARVRAVAADAAAAAGDHGTAAELAEAALAHDPYDEVALRLLMRAHLAARRPASALAAYARTRRRLAEDLGVPPVGETEALHATVLAAADGDTGALPATAPPPALPPLAGRTQELTALDAAAARPPSVVVVHGPAGIGKTALVRAWSGGRRAIVGACDELGRDLPLQPVADALAAHLRGLGPDAAADVLAGEAGVLAEVLGTVGSRAAAPVDADAGRARLFAALLDVVERVADVLVVEDLHHAGRSTLEWLAFVQRRAARLTTVVTSRHDVPELLGAARLALAPLDVDAVAQLVGRDRAADLHARSGGHPLLVVALAAAGDDRPSGVQEAVDRAAGALGPDGERVVRSAAVLGDAVDVDLLAAVLKAPAVDVVASLERGAGAGLLVEHAPGFAVRHALVRQALAAGVGAARQALLHRDAAAVLAARPRPDPLAVAVHAEAGGNRPLAATWYAAASEAALARFDVDAAEAHADAAVALDTSPAPLTARARIRMALYRLEEAAADADRAVALGGGAPSLEVAGWIAYYRRRYGDARRAADDAVALAPDPELRSSCLALSGRVRHGEGDLADASARLEEAVTGPAPARGAAAVWLAAARLHEGRPADALAALDGAPAVDPVGHPFVPLHGRFARAIALGALGRAADAEAAADDLVATAERLGAVGTRFVGVAANVRAWVLRWTGRLVEAQDVLARSLDATADASGLAPREERLSEPFWVARLDLADNLLLSGDTAGAAAVEATLAGMEAWSGTMAWHQRHRLDLLRARLALLDGDRDGAAELAGAVRADAAARGARRYELLAAAVEGTALGQRADLASLDSVVAGLAGCAGLDGWWTVAQLAAATGVERWAAEAERRRAAVAISASPSRR